MLLVTLQIVNYTFNMQGYISRDLENRIREELSFFPVVAIIGPRQCGKSTLARQLLSEMSGTWLDLERKSDLAKLSEPELFFAAHNDELVCLDEIQRKPGIFSVLRSVVDERGGGGHFLVLGSASPELLRQGAESLAGRISYIELAPFLLSEVASTREELVQLWLRGGFPRSFLAPSNKLSFRWREEFVRTYLERDVLHWGYRLPTGLLERLWRMCAHEHGQTLNLSRLGQSLGVSHPTVRSYIDVLCATFMLRQLPPYLPNIGKRLIKAPRLYLRDSGILHCLQGLSDFDSLLGHPGCGASWEGFVIEHAIAALPGWSAHFYRTSAGAELDLVLEKGNRIVAIEAKASVAPKVARGFWSALEDVKPEAAFVVAQVEEQYPLRDGVVVCNLFELREYLQALD